MAQQYDFVAGIDTKVSVLSGESLKDYTRYKRSVVASVLGCDTDEQNKALGPKLYKNLLALNNSIAVLVEQEDPKRFAEADGAKKLRSQAQAVANAKAQRIAVQLQNAEAGRWSTQGS